MFIECIGTEFGTLQICRHIRSVEIPDVKITSVDCNSKKHNGVDSFLFFIPDLSISEHIRTYL